VNVVLDVWLIFGWSGFELAGRTWLAVPAMGVKGAAIGTSVGTVINAVALIWWIMAPRLRKKYQIHRIRRPDWRAIGNMIRVGLPAAFEGFIDMGGFLMFTIFVGTTGAVQLAASQITIQLLSFSFMPLWGLTTAASVLTGNWIGAGHPDTAAHYGRQAYKLGTYYSLILAAVIILLRHELFKVFTNDPEILALGAGLAVSAAIFQYFDGIRMLSSGILQGAGDTRYTMLVTLVPHDLVPDRRHGRQRDRRLVRGLGLLPRPGCGNVEAIRVGQMEEDQDLPVIQLTGGEKMHSVKLILNATMVGVLNLASFVIGFFIFRMSGSGEQRLIQGTAGFLIAVTLVVVWLVVFRKFNRLKVEYDYIRVFLLAFPCATVVFVLVHYVVTGYLTGIGNIVAIGAYLFPMNALALAIAAAIIRRMEKAPRGALAAEPE